ncbi:unnamed protein product [[Actinomadura] parvosata subsp. kistnae]|nr:hypothetical protein [Nonomuraea sp. ATCC 55076]SPL91820.1 unnamed protein product [Actinomadura parvosata subsp. kistnae]
MTATGVLAPPWARGRDRFIVITSGEATGRRIRQAQGTLARKDFRGKPG